MFHTSYILALLEIACGLSTLLLTEAAPLSRRDTIPNQTPTDQHANQLSQMASSNGMSEDEVVAIIVCSVVSALLLIAVLVWFLIKRRDTLRQQQRREDEAKGGCIPRDYLFWRKTSSAVPSGSEKMPASKNVKQSSDTATVKATGDVKKASQVRRPSQGKLFSLSGFGSIKKKGSEGMIKMPKSVALPRRTSTSKVQKVERASCMVLNANSKAERGRQIMADTEEKERRKAQEKAEKEQRKAEERKQKEQEKLDKEEIKAIKKAVVELRKADKRVDREIEKGLSRVATVYMSIIDSDIEDY